MSAVPDTGTYLTDGKRLVQVLTQDGHTLFCEDVSHSCDKPSDIVKLKYGVSRDWRIVLPLAA